MSTTIFAGSRFTSRAAAVGCTVASFAWQAFADEGVDYLKQVKPIFASRCISCHGALKQKEGLRLDTAAAMRKGGNAGPAIEPQRAEGSLLIEKVTTADADERMPPEGDPLTTEQLRILTAWINQGAPAPVDEKPELDPREHWAFRRLVRPAIPENQNRQEAIKNPVDAFIASEHEKRQLTPAPESAREVLLRRVYLDLLGLPPTRQELQTFLADPSRDAYERVVDRLLGDPRYGERWARHWMDIWRYADWHGRRHVPDVWNSAPQIWRWRDWIVRSLNSDKGYDRMIVEMLAADEIAPEDDDAVVATGFLVRNWYALNYNQWMRDNVEHTGKAFLALTFQCAHCHDHKYDPITQRDYFQFRAFFEPLELRQDRRPGEPDCGPFQKYEYTVQRKPVRDGAIRVFDERFDAKTLLYAGGDERNGLDKEPPAQPAMPAFLGGDRIKIEEVALTPAAYYPGIKPFVKAAETGRARQAIAAAREALAKSRQALAEAQETEMAAAEKRAQLDEASVAAAEADLESVSARLAADEARYLRSGEKADELSRTAARADRQFTLLAARAKLLQAEMDAAEAMKKEQAAPDEKARIEAQAAVKKSEPPLSAAKKALAAAETAAVKEGSAYPPFSPLYPTRSTGRRSALAKWIASRDNPLTARVAVNHIWTRHFQTPLVSSVFDFGRNGAPPTHPELLDWLACEFMESGWSMKHLHRLLVTSAAYRRASSVQASNRSSSESETPPPSTSRSNDSTLQRFNAPPDPDNAYLWRMNPGRMEAEALRDSILHLAGELDATMGGRELETTDAATSRRRGLYFSIYPEAGGHEEFLTQFDPPNPSDCYRRTKTVIPQQALAMSNSRLSVHQSRVLARELAGEPDFIAAAFEQILSRTPTPAETAECEAFLKKQAGLFEREKPAVPKATAGSVPPSADPLQRAREGLVHALFNHNDFISVR